MNETVKKPKYGLLLAMVLLGLVVLFAAGWTGCSMIGSVTYSEGERTGTITKFSNKGVFTKTWEGELSIPAPSGSIGVPEKWRFSVDSSTEGVVDKVKKAQQSGDVHTLHYKQRLMKDSFKGQTSYFIINVTETGR